MSQAIEHLVRLTSVRNEMEAGLVVATLEEHGIQAAMAGETTAGFRATTPGWVEVFVAADDMPSAQAIISDVRAEDRNLDWDQVDVGDPEDEPALPDAFPWWASLTLWRSGLVVLVVLVLAILIF